jgi:hypothetical protein
VISKWENILLHRYAEGSFVLYHKGADLMSRY